MRDEMKVDIGFIFYIIPGAGRRQMEKRKQKERRHKDRRRLLTETEFKKLIETGQTRNGDRRAWVERRQPKRRKRQVGV